MNIKVNNLRKIFLREKRAPGAWGALKGLFSRENVEIEAVKNINFEIQEGEFVGFVGPNGAGKTTTLKMLSGILHPSSGDATVLGFTPWKRQSEFQKQFSLVMGQKNQLWWDLPVIESFEFNRAVYEISRENFERQKNFLVEMLGIGHLLEAQVRKLSLGERMKCELAVALIHQPRILFLDEPTIGLDVVSQKAIRDFLRDYNQRERATILLTSHYMEDIRRLCSRVMIIDHGELIYDGTYRELTEKYADTKTIEVIFSAPADRERLERLGRMVEWHEGSARLLVPRRSVTALTSELLRDFPIDDISIHEESMEEIVREIFGENAKSHINST